MITAPAIRKPCLERWDDMRGNNRTRLCERCQLHVQNLSAMSRRDVTRVLSPGHAERVCITYLRGADGVVARATLLREQLLAALRRAFSCLLRPLVPIALALCKTPQKKILAGTWSIVGRHRVDNANRITFNENHSSVSFTRSRTGEGEVYARGSWYADEKHVHIWREGKRYVWDIIELSADDLSLKSGNRVVVYKRVSKASPRASNRAMRRTAR